MKWFTTGYRVQSHHYTVGADLFGRCEDSWCEQHLVRWVKLFGHKLWESTVDREIVPNHVWIAHACLGSDLSGWRSKFYAHI